MMKDGAPKHVFVLAALLRQFKKEAELYVIEVSELVGVSEVEQILVKYQDLCKSF